MRDTSDKMRGKHFEIYQSKNVDEKFRMITEMMEYGVTQTLATLRNWYPKKTKAELQIEFFKLYYKDDFSLDEMERMLNLMRKKST
ncbi:MAG: hypothetical protein AAGI38_24180 [Bacteroidota bacterium]